MDTHNDEDTEMCHSTEKLKSFSDLPDQILVHILSFLPIEDVLNTVLLRSFGDLWCCVPVLDLSSCSYHDCEDEDCPPDYANEKFTDIIRHVSNLHYCGALDKLSLKFCFEVTNDEYLLTWEKDTAVEIEKLIGYSISRKVKVLDLNFKGCGGPVDHRDHYKLPDVFSSKYLTNMRLVACDLRSCKDINLELLRVLVLYEVSLSDEVMENLLAGCPLLEDLSLVECYGLRRLTCENPNLKRVMLSPKLKDFLIISCPYVLSLEMCGRIGRALFGDVSSLVDASICYSIGFKCEQSEYEDVRWLLNRLSQCKTFTACSWSILVLTIWNFKNVPCPSFKWKNLSLELSLTKWHYPGLSLLFGKSQSLETLTISINSGCDGIFTTSEAEWIHAYDFDGENYWDSLEATFPCLESITINGSINAPYVMQMVKFLMKSAIKLKKLVISTTKVTTDQLPELFQEFEALPRASPEAIVCFS